MFNIGDKIYSLTAGPGIGHDYEFAIVIKKMEKTNRYRIQIVEYDSPKNESIPYGDGCKRRVIPNFDKKKFTRLINTDGSLEKPNRKYEKYLDSMKLYSYDDFYW